MKPHVSYVLCATQRSGTHFLGEALQSTGVAGNPDEYLICNNRGQLQNEQGNIAELYGKKTLAEFRRLIVELGSTPNGVFGVTIMWNYFRRILENYRQLPEYQELEAAELMDALLFSPKYVWLVRRNKVRQAVSWAKAAQTGIWSHPRGTNVIPKQEPKFDFLLVAHFHREILAGEAGWSHFFETNGIQPFKLVYEDVVQACEQAVFDLLEFLTIPRPEDLGLGDRRLQKQADGLNEEWATRYRRMKRRAPVRLLALLYDSMPASPIRALVRWGVCRMADY